MIRTVTGDRTRASGLFRQPAGPAPATVAGGAVAGGLVFGGEVAGGAVEAGLLLDGVLSGVVDPVGAVVAVGRVVAGA